MRPQDHARVWIHAGGELQRKCDLTPSVAERHALRAVALLALHMATGYEVIAKEQEKQDG